MRTNKVGSRLTDKVFGVERWRNAELGTEVVEKTDDAQRFPSLGNDKGNRPKQEINRGTTSRLEFLGNPLDERRVGGREHTALTLDKLDQLGIKRAASNSRCRVPQHPCFRCDPRTLHLVTVVVVVGWG